MKTIISLLLFTSCFSVKGQQMKTLDTIYANNQKNVALFFPNPIRQGIVGKSHFVFSYNKETSQYFGLLQATLGEDSNLLAITSDGQIYSYILKYKNELSKLNYFIAQQESIGNEKSSLEILNTKKRVLTKKDTIVSYQSAMYKKTCVELMVNSKKKVKRSKRESQIRLSIKDVTYRDNALYFLMEVENKSGIDYDVNFLRFFISSKSSTKKKSSQLLLKKPIYTHSLPVE
jgi:uncharacterized protein DUF4138